MKLFVTGGAGFIGSAFVRLVLESDANTQVLIFDALTYAGNLENLAPVADNPRYRFVHGNICNALLVEQTLHDFQPDAIVHFAAESHVDRSILAPNPVVDTNFIGTFTLLEAARLTNIEIFLHISTDEVYGSIDPPTEAKENFPLHPSSPYSASKAGSDLLALSYYTTYKLPALVTRASNNYGPYQFPEKLIPLMIANALEDQSLPIYSDGMQIRDWLHVEDHCRALLKLLEKGHPGEIYNIGGNCALPNLEVVHKILDAMDKPRTLIQTVADRPGHDRRYAMSTEKIYRETGWQPTIEFETGLSCTIDWYRSHLDWIQHVRSGEYRCYYDKNYANRQGELSQRVK